MANENNHGTPPSQPMGGGEGEATAPSEPGMIMSGAKGIMILTPESVSLNAGKTTAIVAGQDINLMAGGNSAHCVKGGISMFTKGTATNPDKPNQETGIKLHAASGGFSSHSQSDRTVVTADKSITVTSTTSSVMIQAPKSILLTAGGAYIKMDGMNIEICAPGMVDFKASMKHWTGPQSDSNSLSLPTPSELKGCAMKLASATQTGAASVAR